MEKLAAKLKEEQYKIPFVSALVIGLITHMTMIVNKYPNGDSMTNFYFDQNMVTSGRWFLTVTCGLSSFYDLNFVNGLLAIIFLSVAAVYVTRFFNVKKKSAMILIPAIMMTFPAVAATMTYMYTVDGYMIGLIFAVLAVYTCRKYKAGIAWGALFLAFSMGTYQAYLSMTILLVIFDLMLDVILNKEIKETAKKGLKYLGMGVTGGILYFVILKICLALEHKELDTYQGLNEMGKISASSIPERLYNVYFDFAAFMLRGRIFADNIFSLIAVCSVIVMALAAFIIIFVKSNAYKKWYNYLSVVGLMAIIPLGSNIILMMTDKAEYHLLMRMQWELFLVFAAVILERAFTYFENKKDKLNVAKAIPVILVAIICYNFFLMDNIAYFNLQEKYEKTYAYCVRLLDRIEQTPGYYQGMPICMVGVISEDSYPSTDVTEKVTGKMRGADGDFLIYRGEQYEAFMKHYLGASLNILTGDDVIDMYYSEEYEAMTSFPDAGSIKIVNGIMYIKLE